MRTAIASAMPGQPLGPFDRDHAVGRQILIEADLVELGAIKAIQIDMDQRQSAAAIFVDQRKRRAGHVVGIDAEAFRQSPHERGLARAEIAGQQQHRIRLQIDGASADAIARVCCLGART